MINPLNIDTRIMNENGSMTEEFHNWVSSVYRRGLLVGSGSPEGNIEAEVGREYLDETGSTGAVKFIKQLPDIGGDRKQGWVAI
jgi:hypothetical protein